MRNATSHGYPKATARLSVYLGFSTSPLNGTYSKTQAGGAASPAIKTDKTVAGQGHKDDVYLRMLATTGIMRRCTAA